MNNISVYAREEIEVIELYGDQRCLNRTSNGAPWAMPCCLDKDHEGTCQASSDTKYTITKIN